MFSGREDVPEKKGMDLWKQMSSKCSFTCICGIVLPLNPSTTTVYARSAFYPNLHFTLSLQSAFYTLFAFYPWSAVCVLHWPLRQLVVCGALREIHQPPATLTTRPRQGTHDLNFELERGGRIKTNFCFFLCRMTNKADVFFQPHW